MLERHRSAGDSRGARRARQARGAERRGDPARAAEGRRSGRPRRGGRRARRAEAGRTARRRSPRRIAFGQRDATYIARAAALGALAKYGAAAATPVLTSALRRQGLGGARARGAAAEAARSAAAAMPTRRSGRRRRTLPPTSMRRRASSNPPVSTQVYIDTDRGTIQIELAVLDAPLTVENFITLARKGFFNGLSVHRVVPDFVVQDGDPRGDGEGGPGYTIRDELNERPYLRGTVGMALDWADTGGSQFFITHSPQPHLDAKYTVFGRVIAGMDVVDRDSAVGRDSARAGLGRQPTTTSSDGVEVGGCDGRESRTAGKLKRGRRPPPFYRRERSAYRFLPAFFFPPLAFFAIVCYPPLHVGLLARALTVIVSGCRLARSPDVGARRFWAPPR